MTDSMIERMARALCRLDAPKDEPELERLTWKRNREIYESQARTAIRSMREPTEAIVNAINHPHCDICSEEAWRRAIDAALKE